MLETAWLVFPGSGDTDTPSPAIVRVGLGDNLGFCCKHGRLNYIVQRHHNFGTTTELATVIFVNMEIIVWGIIMDNSTNLLSPATSQDKETFVYFCHIYLVVSLGFSWIFRHYSSLSRLHLVDFLLPISPLSSQLSSLQEMFNLQLEFLFSLQKMLVLVFTRP